MQKIVAVLLAYILCALPVAEAQTQTITAMRHRSSGGSAPSIVQVANATTTTCNAYVENASYTCALASNAGSGHYLFVEAMQEGGLVTSWSSPTCSGAGCPSSWTACGTANGFGAAWISSTTSAGAVTVTIANNASGASSNDAAIGELSGITGTCTGTPVFEAYTFCSSCTGPSITTGHANAIVMGFSVQTSAFTGLGTGSLFTLQINDATARNNSSEYHFVATYIATSTGSYDMTWTSGGNNGATQVAAVY